MLHITSTEDGEATWQIASQRISMESFIDYRRPGPAYRMRMDGTTVDIPNGAPGLVLLGEGDERPDLPLVREWFTELFGLWDAVQAAYWDVRDPLDEPRVGSLDQVAYDYTTGEWNASEIREIACRTRESA
ncbi:hypothetical protein [Nocardia brasiliensis]|uniref:hypothetical protein n=1 Tax=Nocardia brasiliensis TaxID=37326 RepID=UPI00366E1CB5